MSRTKRFDACKNVDRHFEAVEGKFKKVKTIKTKRSGRKFITLLNDIVLFDVNIWILSISHCNVFFDFVLGLFG